MKEMDFEKSYLNEDTIATDNQHSVMNIPRIAFTNSDPGSISIAPANLSPLRYFDNCVCSCGLDGSSDVHGIDSESTNHGCTPEKTSNE